MAKGFTVKHLRLKGVKKQDKPEWDYDAIKGTDGKTIVFCLPGRGCSYTFMKNFVQLCFDMVQNGMSIQISQDYSSMVNLHVVSVLVRMFFVDLIKYLGMVSFYDYQLWIDSDIVFNTEKFWQLCDVALPITIDENGDEIEGADHPISAGWYSTEDGKTTLSCTLVGRG